MPPLTADLIARVNAGEQDARDSIDDVAAHALRLATLHPIARIVATHQVADAILNAPADLTTYGPYVRQAARRAVAETITTDSDDVVECEAIIRDACRKAAAGYPTITPEHLIADVWLELQRAKSVHNLRGLIYRLARTALKRRLTADSAHGLGGEGDARRGGGGLTEYLRELTNDKRSGVRTAERDTAMLEAARQAVQDAPNDAARSVALARLDKVEARLVGEAQAETRNVWVYLDAVRDDGTTQAADFEFVTTGELGETDASVRWSDALTDAAWTATGWGIVKTTRAVATFWQGALREVRRGGAGYKPSLLSLGATLSRREHSAFFAAEAGLTASEWKQFVTLLCGRDVTASRPGQVGLIVQVRPDLASTATTTRLAPVTTLPTSTEQVAA